MELVGSAREKGPKVSTAFLIIEAQALMDYCARLMEKDNKKARDDAKREYNDTVRVSVL